jgi:hypothetical protein
MCILKIINNFKLPFWLKQTQRFKIAPLLKSSTYHYLLVRKRSLFTNENIYFENCYDEQSKFTYESYSIYQVNIGHHKIITVYLRPWVPYSNFMKMY